MALNMEKIKARLDALNKQQDKDLCRRLGISKKELNRRRSMELEREEQRQMSEAVRHYKPMSTMKGQSN